MKKKNDDNDSKNSNGDKDGSSGSNSSGSADIKTDSSDDLKFDCDSKDTKCCGDSSSCSGVGSGSKDNEKENDDALYQKKLKNMGKHMCGVMWYVSQMDIENTLTKACNKVMRDHSVTDDIRHRRALGLKVLGQEFVKAGGSMVEGFDDFVSKIGDSMEAAANSASAHAHGEGKE